MTEELRGTPPISPECPKLGLNDRIDFQCDRSLNCFTKCCRDVAIVLTPYDVLQLKRALQLDSTEFLNKYTILSCTKTQQVPIVIVKMNADSDKRCPFVTPEECSIYAHRPWACRMYPLGFAEPSTPLPGQSGFYFVVHEDLCQGHGRGTQSTVRDWIATQKVDAFEMMGESFSQLMTNDFWRNGTPLGPQKLEMYLMACYDLDRFRRFIFESRFRELFEVDEQRLEAIRTDDEELLEFAMQWLRFSLFNEKTMKLKTGVADAQRPPVVEMSTNSQGGMR